MHFSWYLPHPGSSFRTTVWPRYGVSAPGWHCNGEWGYYTYTRYSRWRWLGCLKATASVIPYRLLEPWSRRHHPTGGIMPWWYELLMGDLWCAWMSLKEWRWT